MRKQTIECASAEEAVRRAASLPGHVAILVEGARLVVPGDTIDKLTVLGTSFAYIVEHGGQFICIPANPEI